MSRMAALLAIAMAAPAHADVMEAYRERTAVEPRCWAAQGDEIMVCGRRDADRYRVPFESKSVPGDPKTTNVHEERSRLTATQNSCEQRGAYVYGCGMVGVTVRTKLGAGAIEYRPLAR